MTLKTFSDLGVPRPIIRALSADGITQPFAIQEATIAAALAGRDLSARAPTGSGKTLAFSIPLAARVASGAPHRPRGLVLVPTRELATQVATVLRPLAATQGRSVATFFGGTNLRQDQRRLRRSVDIAVACPGRLADLVRRGDADLSDVDVVVIDEADRMADMGFLPEVKRLLDQTAADRQTLLFSATLDGDVDVLVRRYQRDPVRREVAADEESSGDTRHFFWRVDADARVALTGDVIRASSSAIVFTRTKRAADRLSKQLTHRGIRCAAIHGNRSQGQRERALADFTAGRVAALVATDVAARGIHVDGVGVVVHYDPPATGKDYVHRSGRTGRAGADGAVVTLAIPANIGDVKSLQRALRIRGGIGGPTIDDLGGHGGVRLDLPESPQGQALPVPTASRKAQSRSNGNRTRNSNGSGSGRRRNGSGNVTRSAGQRKGNNGRGRREHVPTR